MDAISLYKLHEQIKRVLALNFSEPIFIKAEISRVNVSRGHFYLELADKDNADEHLRAKAQAVLWKNNAIQLKNKLKENFDELLQEGLQIAFYARVQFHEVYGLKLLIEDIDLEYSLGVVARERAEIIQQLEKEGLIGLNAQLTLPSVIQSVAIISSPTAAGYSDFLESITNNPFGLKIECDLFPSAMQGLSVEKELTDQLLQIEQKKEKFDLVVIIRGGGGKLDLSYFDNYAIGKGIANFRLPVLTGIGHQIDETVTDRVAHSSFKTPTAVAEFIIQHNLRYLTSIQELRTSISATVRQRIEAELWSLKSTKREIQNQSRSIIRDQEVSLSFSRKELRSRTQQLVEQQFIELKHFSERIELLDPRKILERGFTAAEQDQKRISRKEDLDLKRKFSLYFSNGKIEIDGNE